MGAAREDTSAEENNVCAVVGFPDSDGASHTAMDTSESQVPVRWTLGPPGSNVAWTEQAAGVAEGVAA